MAPHQHYLTRRTGWLRAAVLGANDGIISTASLIVGVAAAAATRGEVLLAGVAGLVAGAMSMAAGEYVSVSSQTDAEKADLRREKHELAVDPDYELNELTQIYIERGLDRDLAAEVARQLTAKDALAAHARDELGITELTRARPVEAALASGAAFSAGAALPLLAASLTPIAAMTWVTPGAALGSLAVLGVISARAGGGRTRRATLRVLFWGALAMAATAAVGTLFGAAI